MRTTAFYLLLVSTLAIACTGGQGTSSNGEECPVTLDSIIVDEKMATPFDGPDDKSGSIRVKFIYPTDFGTAEQLEKLQSIFYKGLGDECTIATSPQDAVTKYMEYFSSEDFSEELEYLEYFESEWENRIFYTNKNVMSITVSSSFDDPYAAFVDIAYSCYAIDLQNLRRLTLDDMLMRGYEDDLVELLREEFVRQLKKEFSADELDEYLDGFWDDCGTCGLDAAFDNFLLAETGIVFVYNSEEIGSITSNFMLPVLYEEIAELLNRETFARLFPNVDLN